MNKNLSVCFTGHRPNKFGTYDELSPILRIIRQELRLTIKQAIVAGYSEFISGMAIGVDTWAAECVLEFKEEFPDIKLICAIPFDGQEKKWPQESQKRYWKIISQADEVHIISEGKYTPIKMQIRNEWMVDNSSLIIAVWDGSQGGTGNCVAYAKNKKKQMIQINPKKMIDNI